MPVGFNRGMKRLNIDNTRYARLLQTRKTGAWAFARRAVTLNKPQQGFDKMRTNI
ncbi:MAG TPA: hypothetical protein VFV38_41735 [Ktedonobacteraceae bacterium]|nr:hypothetical protein [Ktedonobacteraceae bacterium]